MTQTEFAKWIDNVLGDMPMEEVVSPEILEHMDRVHLDSESRAWNAARMEDRTSFEIAVRAMAKTLFVVGYSAGREQGDIDTLLGGTFEEDVNDSPKNKRSDDLDDEGNRGAFAA